MYLWTTGLILPGLVPDHRCTHSDSKNMTAGTWDILMSTEWEDVEASVFGIQSLDYRNCENQCQQEPRTTQTKR